MPSIKKTDLEKLAWSWTESVSPDNIERAHLETSYRIGLKNCKNCKRNCSNNPRCLTGLGEEKYLKSQPTETVSLESSLLELRDPTQYVGLKNLGATCYVNSLIQVWFHNQDMRRIIYKWEITEDPEERECLRRARENGQPYQPVTAVGQLQYIFAMMQFGNRDLVDPTSLAIALSLDTGTQQDAQEFSKLLLAHIEVKLQQNVALKSMLQRLTQGTYIYVNRCSTCATEYPTSTTFYELDLQLAPTLKEAMENYLSEEELVGANKYHCRNCNDKQDAKRFIRLDSLPDTLNFQLLRFVFHRESAQKKKLTSSIQFPEELDMSEYLRCPSQTHLYNLVAVLSHKGPSAHSGHYIVNIRNSSGEWYQFSDDKVEMMHNKRIEDGINDGGKPTKRGRVLKGCLISNSAYMLVYKRSDSKARRALKASKNHKDDNNIPTSSSTRSETKVRGDCLPDWPENTKRKESDDTDDESHTIFSPIKKHKGDGKKEFSGYKNENHLHNEELLLSNEELEHLKNNEKMSDCHISKTVKKIEFSDDLSMDTNNNDDDDDDNNDDHDDHNDDDDDHNDNPDDDDDDNEDDYDGDGDADNDSQDEEINKIETDDFKKVNVKSEDDVSNHHNNDDSNEIKPSNDEAPDKLKNKWEKNYELLNGDAHRKMGCLEREYYESMEFEKWEVSETLCDLIKQENVKHELILMATQEEKRKEIENQNIKRQEVIDFYTIINNTTENNLSEYEWVPTSWLSKWISDHSGCSELIAPIDNSILMCAHHKLDPSKVNRAKTIPMDAASLIYNKYKGGPRLDKNSLCEVCVKRRCKTLRFKSELERDHKEVIEVMRNEKERETDNSFIVGAVSLKYWRRLAMDQLEGSNQDDSNNDNEHLSENNKSENAKDDDEEESDVLSNFNDDLLCEHGSLRTSDASRKIVPAAAWNILRKYFPAAMEYSATTAACSICEEKVENAKRAKEDDKIKAKQQKEELNDIYYGKKRDEILKCQDKKCYIVEKGFIDAWKSFVRNVGKSEGPWKGPRHDGNVITLSQNY
ncbi:hypothetical protein PV325_011420 [Microctonus aethiopoides]|nr:hypothetical protein PV325_011420 [Microctonus aethiopoides]